MSRKRFKPEQIIRMLREAEVDFSQGMKVRDICRGLGISEQTYYRWRREYGGLNVYYVNLPTFCLSISQNFTSSNINDLQSKALRPVSFCPPLCRIVRKDPQPLRWRSPWFQIMWCGWYVRATGQSLEPVYAKKCVS